MKTPKRYEKHWKQRYISALINALGAATILHLETDCKTLHELARREMGLNKPETKRKTPPE